MEIEYQILKAVAVSGRLPSPECVRLSMNAFIAAPTKENKRYMQAILARMMCTSWYKHSKNTKLLRLNERRISGS